MSDYENFCASLGIARGRLEGGFKPEFFCVSATKVAQPKGAKGPRVEPAPAEDLSHLNPAHSPGFNISRWWATLTPRQKKAQMARRGHLAARKA